MPLREFGGVSRAELLKTIWVPATGGTTRVTKGNHTAYRIANPGDEAVCETFIPISFTTLREARVQFICNATLANMFVNVNIDYGTWGQVYNNTTGGVILNFATVINTIMSLVIEALLAGIPSGIRLGTRITYNAGLDATNIDVLGLVTTWT